jgi:hypothetical protein
MDRNKMKMTLQEAFQKIDTLQHLVGQKAPKWNSPILEIIPAATDKFSTYIQVYQKTMNLEKAIQASKSSHFDILLIFRTPKLHGNFVYEWYSFFYQ